MEPLANSPEALKEIPSFERRRSKENRTTGPTVLRANSKRCGGNAAYPRVRHANEQRESVYQEVTGEITRPEAEDRPQCTKMATPGFDMNARTAGALKERQRAADNGVS